MYEYGIAGALLMFTVDMLLFICLICWYIANSRERTLVLSFSQLPHLFYCCIKVCGPRLSSSQCVLVCSVCRPEHDFLHANARAEQRSAANTRDIAATAGYSEDMNASTSFEAGAYDMFFSA